MTSPQNINQNTAIGGTSQTPGDEGMRGSVDVGSGVATASAGAATLNQPAGVVTSEALTTAAAAAYTLTLTNTYARASDIVVFSVANGTNTQGIPTVGRATPADGSIVFTVTNLHATQALNGTIKIAYFVAR